MTNPTPLPVRRIHDAVEEIETDIEYVMRKTTSLPRNMMPTTEAIMSTQMRELDDLGRMSAEAVLTQYEATAKEVESMGDLVKEMVKKLGASLIECDADMKFVAETAAAIREKGKHSQALIEQVSALSTALRTSCVEFKKKMEVR
jgi:hypothetical protein